MPSKRTTTPDPTTVTIEVPGLDPITMTTDEMEAVTAALNGTDAGPAAELARDLREFAVVNGYDDDLIDAVLGDPGATRPASPTLAEFGCEASTLAAALGSVLPHASTDPDNHPELAKVYLAVEGGLTAWATDDWTVAAHHTPGGNLFDFGWEIADAAVQLPDVALLLRVFKPPKDGTRDVRVTITDDRVTVRDVSVLFGGRELAVPNVHKPERPDKALPQGLGTLRAALTRPVQPSIGLDVSTWATHGELWARFAQSAKVLGGAMVIETGDRDAPIVVTVGATFAGALTPAYGEVDSTKRGKLRDAWIRRLPVLVAKEKAAAV